MRLQFERWENLAQRCHILLNLADIQRLERYGNRFLQRFGCAKEARCTLAILLLYRQCSPGSQTGSYRLFVAECEVAHQALAKVLRCFMDSASIEEGIA